MNTPSREDIIRIKITRAVRTLSEAEKIIEFNFANAALNRLYYSCYYAATALLFSKDIFTKTHSGVQQMTGLHFVTPGLLSTDDGRFFSELFRSRMCSDYDDFSDPDIAMVKGFAARSKEFIKAVCTILNIKTA